MITRDEILKGREINSPLTPQLEANLEKLLIAVNKLRLAYGKPMFVSSGYRPAEINAAVGGSKKSAHMTCQAVDFRDGDGKLTEWCLNNIQVLIDAGLYMEDPEFTNMGPNIRWVHVQIRPTKKRIFKPY